MQPFLALGRVVRILEPEEKDCAGDVEELVDERGKRRTGLLQQHVARGKADPCRRLERGHVALAPFLELDQRLFDGRETDVLGSPMGVGLAFVAFRGALDVAQYLGQIVADLTKLLEPPEAFPESHELSFEPVDTLEGRVKLALRLLVEMN